MPFCHHLSEDQAIREDELRTEKAWVLDKAEPINSSTPCEFQMFETLARFSFLNQVSWALSLATERLVPEDKREVSGQRTKQAHSEH